MPSYVVVVEILSVLVSGVVGALVGFAVVIFDTMHGVFGPPIDIDFPPPEAEQFRSSFAFLALWVVGDFVVFGAFALLIVNRIRSRRCAQLRASAP